ncbi:MAG: hypothetical protein ACPG7F_00940 [Aggregatilineales bacterium]
MSLSSTISAGNLTKIRSDKYQCLQFVVTVPDTIVVQFQPSAVNSDAIYAEIAVGTIASGAIADVKSFQTVIYSTSPDYANSELYRTYVRDGSTSSILKVGQNGQNLELTHYITVLNTYEVHEKPRTQKGTIEYADWDITFRRLLPVETALPTAIVLTGGTTAWTPTAVPAAIDADASSSFTHSWESSNSNDTLDSGGTTASPVWTLEAGAHRWIRYTFTDSNGNANLRVITIWTIPADLSSGINEGFVGENGDVADISYSQGDGWSCSFPAYASISDLRAGTMACVFSLEWYNDTAGSIESNIDFVGYLGQEVTETTGSDEYGYISETRFTVNGFGSLMNVAPISPVSIQDRTSPTAWSHIKSPTPVRALIYLLSEHTTLFHLCAFTFPSDHTDYIAPGYIFESSSDVIADAARYQADAMDCILQFARDGRMDMQRNLVQDDDTARDAADVIITLTPDDFLSYSFDFDPVKQIKFYRLHAGVYNTTSGEYDIYQSFVPPMPDNRGTNTEQRTNVILTTNSSASAAQSEFSDRAANLYAAMNPTVLMRCTLKDEFRFLQPDVGTWYKLTIAATDTVRGYVYGSSHRWQLLDLSYSTNNEDGLHGGVSATFRLETQNTGANIDVAQIRKPTTTEAEEYTFLPAILPPGVDANLEDFTGGMWDDTQGAGAPDDEIPPSTSSCENHSMTAPNGATGYTTITEAVSSENVALTVRGNGKLDSGGWVLDIDLKTTNGGFTADFGTYTPGTGWVATDGGASRLIQITKALGADYTINSVVIYFDFTKGTYNQTEPDAQSVSLNDDAVAVGNTTLGNSVALEGSAQQLSYTGSVTADAVSVILQTSEDQSGSPSYDGAATFYRIVLTGTGTAPSGATSSQDFYGDAFYFSVASDFANPQPYSSGAGFLINASSPGTIPPFNENHEYPVADIVSAGTVDLTFNSPYGNSNADSFTLSGEICFNGA